MTDSRTQREQNQTVAGVDACPAGWLVTAISPDGAEIDVFEEFEALAEAYSDADRVLVDIPIGLEAEARRRCDVDAKEALGSRGLSVFYAPCEAAVEQAAVQQEGGVDVAYAIRVLRDGVEIERVGGKTQAEAMGQLVEYLIKEEGLLEAIEVPYIPGTGRGSRALLNDEPVHASGDDMRQYETLSGGYYLFTSLSAKDKQRYVSELPQQVGLMCEFLDW